MSRKIATVHIFYCDGKPIAMINDRKKVDLLLEKAKNKRKEAYIKSITAPEERVEQIGNNIFKRLEKMTEKEIDNILLIRNNLVRATLEVATTKKIDEESAWKTVMKQVKSKTLPLKNMTYKDFCQWTLDVSDYLDVKRL